MDGDDRDDEAQSTRRLSRKKARALAPGDEHYTAYVGPPTDYDLMGASQFRLLCALGLREHHDLLDFGCGSLRAGRLFIPYLNPGRYHGVEPNRWLIEDAVAREVGADQIRIKRPVFLHNDDFRVDGFGKRFDFILAQSILSHTARDLALRVLVRFGHVLKPTGLIACTFVHEWPGQPTQGDAGWVYPSCVDYRPQHVLDLIGEAGLVGRALPWFHPRQTWYVAALAAWQLPSRAKDAHLTGAVLRDPSTMASH
ncbi:MAG TPA: class I SAM-dependent methyltransferase [Caulobacteraceae bacterium]